MVWCGGDVVMVLMMVMVWWCLTSGLAGSFSGLALAILLAAVFIFCAIWNFWAAKLFPDVLFLRSGRGGGGDGVSFVSSALLFSFGLSSLLLQKTNVLVMNYVWSEINQDLDRFGTSSSSSSGFEDAVCMLSRFGTFFFFFRGDCVTAFVFPVKITISVTQIYSCVGMLPDGLVGFDT